MTDLIANLGAQRTKRPHRHNYGYVRLDEESRAYQFVCPCGAIKDETASRRGKNNRTRGNAWEVELAHMLEALFEDSHRAGMFGGKDDVVAGPLRIQCKKDLQYPKRIDDLIRQAESRCNADEIPAAAFTAPEPIARAAGDWRHKIIALDVRDFIRLLLRAWEGEPRG